MTAAQAETEPPVTSVHEVSTPEEWVACIDSDEEDFGPGQVDDSTVLGPDGHTVWKATKIFELGCKHTIYFDQPKASKKSGTYESGLKAVGEFITIQEFTRYWNAIVFENLMPASSLCVFREDVKPMWEHKANEYGGRWLIPASKDTKRMLQFWDTTGIALVAGEFDGILAKAGDAINGVVLKNIKKLLRIEFWMRTVSEEAINAMNRKIRELLEINDTEGLHLEFKPFHENHQSYAINTYDSKDVAWN